MRLLDTCTGLFHWTDGPSETSYAILSHVWCTLPTSDQSYEDIVRIQASQDGGMAIWADVRVNEKIRNACAVAWVDGHRYLWIDSCCIDKTSSAELSEAINSMYEWYAQADICYAYLEDVDDDDDLSDPLSSFRYSKWHSRGWTLQELIAPKSLLFLSRQWHPLGTKHSLAVIIEQVTGVDREILIHTKQLDQVSIAKRMSWASKRTTTRIEDEAYSLMGIFGVHMTTIYGERQNAFRRLQEEILRRNPDQSIFAWGGTLSRTFAEHLDYFRPEDMSSLLAPSPKHFVFSGNISSIRHSDFLGALCLPFDHPYPLTTHTPYGIRMNSPLIPSAAIIRLDEAPPQASWLLVLQCRDKFGRLIALPLQRSPGSEPSLKGVQIGAGDTDPGDDASSSGKWNGRVWPISRKKLEACLRSIFTAEVILPVYPARKHPTNSNTPRRIVRTREFFLCDWCRPLLSKHGFELSQVIQGAIYPDSVFILISSKAYTSVTIRISYHHHDVVTVAVQQRSLSQVAAAHTVDVASDHASLIPVAVSSHIIARPAGTSSNGKSVALSPVLEMHWVGNTAARSRDPRWAEYEIEDISGSGSPPTRIRVGLSASLDSDGVHRTGVTIETILLAPPPRPRRPSTPSRGSRPTLLRPQTPDRVQLFSPPSASHQRTGDSSARPDSPTIPELNTSVFPSSQVRTPPSTPHSRKVALSQSQTRPPQLVSHHSEHRATRSEGQM
ncbi:heterokaryon incompatibility protein-domain-containing protein [Dichomitus squalens]|uniref:Heterokaryon incompatibility protein-domain-containing protein n=1 Tax=Dichomitus squalens TaxID=114155 RepID=A0A4Q9PVE7_9APHY|nr:heterokaryon incompatibility protein-domain-containing protein [Dichomitus squalens]